jgi:DNA-binding PadR family transcriptional regulator
MMGFVLDLAILGFLAERPLPGHELRRRVSGLTGYTRPVSDGSLYPAIKRLAAAGLVERRADPAAGAARYVLSVTDVGRAELLKRLRTPAEHEISDFTRFFTVLAFLSLVPDVAEQHAVLRRRLEFLEEPASFFYHGDRPLRAEDVADPYRRGMLLTARAISAAERAWLHQILDRGEPVTARAETDHSTLEEPVSRPARR